MRLVLQAGERRHAVELRADGDAFVLERAGVPSLRVEVLAHEGSSLVLRVGGQQARVRYARMGRDLFLQLGAQDARFHLVDEQEEQDLQGATGGPEVLAPMPGKILAVLVAVGDAVAVGQPVVRMEAMKMEVDVAARVAGTVAAVLIKPGELVGPAATLLTLNVVSD